MLKNYREAIVSKHLIINFDACLSKARSCFRISRNFIIKLWVIFENFYKTRQSKYRFMNKFMTNNELLLYNYYIKLMYHYVINSEMIKIYALIVDYYLKKVLLLMFNYRYYFITIIGESRQAWATRLFSKSMKG